MNLTTFINVFPMIVNTFHACQRSLTTLEVEDHRGYHAQLDSFHLL